ncbi:MAG TPA: SAV_915 family protein [Pseudonocardiaceae bacterium]|nr:SAV_915 family protein [Pseudonocardiaceae bacterium]
MVQQGFVYVPAYPNRENDRRDIAFDLRRSDDGALVAIAFSSLERLIGMLGRYQPWVCVSEGRFRSMIGSVGVRQVVIDPVIDVAANRVDLGALHRLGGE